MNDDLVIVGGGAHAKVVKDTLEASGFKPDGITDPDTDRASEGTIHGISYLGGDEVVLSRSPAEVRLLNGVASTEDTGLHRNLYEKFHAEGYDFMTIVHPTAFVSDSVEVSNGTQVMAGAVVQPGTSLGKNVVVNTSVSVDHDCTIHEHSHLAPGVVLSGGVTVGPGSHLGTGVDVIQNITIGEGAFVAAGAVVTEDVPDQTHVAGVPAKEMKT